ncbi:hypothetical protein, partial [Streptomyces lunaelactis]|uniref:hypothetical protein n=1 Tax=Streptomyces lunaelactis TaxID=1535768 RepID=UPI001C2FA033
MKSEALNRNSKHFSFFWRSVTPAAARRDPDNAEMLVAIPATSIPLVNSFCPRHDSNQRPKGCGGSAVATGIRLHRDFRCPLFTAVPLFTKVPSIRPDPREAVA